jgi:hypothetical protein
VLRRIWGDEWGFRVARTLNPQVSLRRKSTHSASSKRRARRTAPLIAKGGRSVAGWSRKRERKGYRVRSGHADGSRPIGQSFTIHAEALLRLASLQHRCCAPAHRLQRASNGIRRERTICRSVFFRSRRCPWAVVKLPRRNYFEGIVCVGRQLRGRPLVGCP